MMLSNESRARNSFNNGTSIGGRSNSVFRLSKGENSPGLTTQRGDQEEFLDRVSIRASKELARKISPTLIN